MQAYCASCILYNAQPVYSTHKFNQSANYIVKMTASAMIKQKTQRPAVCEIHGIDYLQVVL